MMLDISNLGVEKDLFLHQIRENESTSIFNEQLEDGMDVIDIGANIGYYSLIEAKYVGKSGNIMAIEPAPENFERLQENIVLNQYDNIDCIKKAVGAEKRTANMNISKAPNRNRIGTGNTEKETIEVEVDTVDDLAKEMEPDFIRMDVEGYEIEILKGMENILETESLKLFLEIHPKKIEKFYDGNSEEIWEKLSNKDFRIKYLVRHPPRAKLSYFFRKQHAPRKVLKPDMPISEALEEFSDFFDWENTFRVFLEKY